MTKIVLEHGESILAVVPEYAVGPGWSNTPLFVYIAGNDGKVRTECIQPDKQTKEQRALFSVLSAAQSAMLRTLTVKEKPRPNSDRKSNRT